MKTIEDHNGWLRSAVCFLFTLFAGTFSVLAQRSPQAGDLFPNADAYIVVTGMRLNEDPGNLINDATVAEGALVKVSMKNGASEEKATKRFIPANNPKDLYFSADFKIAFDSTYTIEMTFKDGHKIVVNDYKILPQWKTHFYFHSTNGTKSPASVMRRQEDKVSKLNCLIYGLYPFSNYKALGGTQLSN
jgi:hypothetical protein